MPPKPETASTRLPRNAVEGRHSCGRVEHRLWVALDLAWKTCIIEWVEQRVIVGVDLAEVWNQVADGWLASRFSASAPLQRIRIDSFSAAIELAYLVVACLDWSGERRVSAEGQNGCDGRGLHCE